MKSIANSTSESCLTITLPCRPGIEASLGWCVMTGHWIIHNHTLRTRCLNELVLLYCKAGIGKLYHNKQEIDIQAGDLFCCFPFLAHGYKANPLQGWELYWLHCKGQHPIDLVQRAGITTQKPVIRIGQPERIVAAFKNILDIAEEDHLDADWDCASALQKLLFEINKDQFASSSSPSIVKTMHYNDSSLEAMAKKAGFSKFHYSRLFKQQVGISPWQFLIRLKVNKARELLLGSQLSIKQISAELHFDNPDYFAKIFKQHIGISPRDFRGKK
jgi:AraC family transcriptional regulator, arabinose operon regulatory protein